MSACNPLNNKSALDEKDRRVVAALRGLAQVEAGRYRAADPITGKRDYLIFTENDQAGQAVGLSVQANWQIVTTVRSPTKCITLAAQTGKNRRVCVLHLFSRRSYQVADAKRLVACLRRIFEGGVPSGQVPTELPRAMIREFNLKEL